MQSQKYLSLYLSVYVSSLLYILLISGFIFHPARSHLNLTHDPGVPTKLTKCRKSYDRFPLDSESVLAGAPYTKSSAHKMPARLTCRHSREESPRPPHVSGPVQPRCSKSPNLGLESDHFGKFKLDKNPCRVRRYAVVPYTEESTKQGRLRRQFVARHKMIHNTEVNARRTRSRSH